MKTILKAVLGVVVLAVFGYTIYFLYNKSKEDPIVYETQSPE